MGWWDAYTILASYCTEFLGPRQTQLDRPAAKKKLSNSWFLKMTGAYKYVYIVHNMYGRCRSGGARLVPSPLVVRHSGLLLLLERNTLLVLLAFLSFPARPEATWPV